MSDAGERLTSLKGLVTSAKRIDVEYNLKSDPFRIVTSDGVLFCIPKRDFLQRFKTLHTLLRILGFGFAEFDWEVDVSTYCNVILLAEKFQFESVVRFCRHRIRDALRMEQEDGSRPAMDNSLRVFAAAAVLDLEDIAALAAASHMMHGRGLDPITIGDLIHQIPVVYAFALFIFRDRCKERSPYDSYELEFGFLESLEEMKAVSKPKAAATKMVSKRKRGN